VSPGFSKMALKGTFGPKEPALRTESGMNLGISLMTLGT